jgi:hypothetical protein
MRFTRDAPFVEAIARVERDWESSRLLFADCVNGIQSVAGMVQRVYDDVERYYRTQEVLEPWMGITRASDVLMMMPAPIDSSIILPKLRPRRPSDLRSKRTIVRPEVRRRIGFTSSSD